MSKRYTYDLGESDKRQNLFKELNVDLRELASQEGEAHKNLVATWAPLIKNMLSGMAKMPKHQQKSFYRGRPESFSDLRQLYRGGRHITWAAFTSVSKRIDEAHVLLFCLFVLGAPMCRIDAAPPFWLCYLAVLFGAPAYKRRTSRRGTRAACLSCTATTSLISALSASIPRSRSASCRRIPVSSSSPMQNRRSE